MEFNLSTILQVLTLLGIMFAIYKTFRDPDVNAEKTLAVMEERCKLKHQNIDENILAIKENHLRHLESDVAQMKIDLTKVLTILQEREKKVL